MTGFPYSKRDLAALEHGRFMVGGSPKPLKTMLDAIIAQIKQDIDLGEIRPEIDYAYRLAVTAYQQIDAADLPERDRQTMSDMLEAHRFAEKGLKIIGKIAREATMKDRTTKANNKDMFRILRHLAIAKRAMQNLHKRNRYGIDPDSGEYSAAKDPVYALNVEMGEICQTAKTFAVEQFNIAWKDEDEEKVADAAEKAEGGNE